MHEGVFFIIKTLISGVLIASISSLAKVFPKWAALLTALPLMTYLSLFWIYHEQKDLDVLKIYVFDVMLWLIPGIPFFIASYFLFKQGVNFYVSMTVSTLILFGSVFLIQKMGILK